MLLQRWRPWRQVSQLIHVGRGRYHDYSREEVMELISNLQTRLTPFRMMILFFRCQRFLSFVGTGCPFLAQAYLFMCREFETPDSASLRFNLLNETQTNFLRIKVSFLVRQNSCKSLIRNSRTDLFLETRWTERGVHVCGAAPRSCHAGIKPLLENPLLVIQYQSHIPILHDQISQLLVLILIVENSRKGTQSPSGVGPTWRYPPRHVYGKKTMHASKFGGTRSGVAEGLQSPNPSCSPTKKVSSHYRRDED